MKRRSFNILAAVSLVLFVATVVLWVRSYATGDAIWRDSTSPDYVRGSLICIQSAGGRVACEFQRRHFEGLEAGKIGPSYGEDAGNHYRRQPTEIAFGDYLKNEGIRCGPFIIGTTGWEVQRSPKCVQIASGFIICFPYWFPAVILSWPIVFWGSRRIRQLQQRTPPGSCPCPTCGYDLRATPDRCPECGTEVKVLPSK